MIAPPCGWQDARSTWLRIWDGANRELARNPWSARATLVGRTALRRLQELTRERDAALRCVPARCARCRLRARDVLDDFYCAACRDELDQERIDAREDEREQ